MYALLASCALLTTQLLFAMENRNNKQDSDVTSSGKKLQAILLPPVTKFLLDELNDEGRRVVGAQIANMEYSWPHTNVDLKYLTDSDGLLELRTHLPNSCSTRVAVLPRIKDKELVCLHAFFKNADRQNTDIALAKKRARDYEKHKDDENGASSLKKQCKKMKTRK